MADPEHIRQYYNLTDEFGTEWTDVNTSSDIDIGSSGDTSKYALLRQLVSAHSSAISDLPYDEPDPLGSTPSVVAVLRSRGIDVKDASKRNRYLISSTTFSPRLFLRDVHPDATYNNLVNSLNYLESRISERSEALRYLIEHDYDRFVQAKSSLDSVFKNIQAASFNDPDSRLGFQRLKSLIDDSNAKATILMKPIMDNKAKDERLRTALALVDGNKYLFNLPSLILTHIKNNDHDSLIRDYRRGKDMRSSESELLSSSEDLTNKIEKQRVLERIWNEVEEIVDEYKKQTWKKLAETSAEQNYTAIITKLMELGVEDNPITEWISSQTQLFENEFKETFSKLQSATANHRKNILTVPQNHAVPLLHVVKSMAEIIDATSGSGSSGNSNNTTTINKDSILYDSPSVLEMWMAIRIIFQDVNGLISRFCIFWRRVQEFMDGLPQRNLPSGWQNESRSHLTFSSDELEAIKQGSHNITELVSSNIRTFFTENASHNIQDVPSKNEKTPSFLPPFSNALSAVKYLPKILYSIGSGFNDLSISLQSPSTTSILRTVLTSVRERAVNAILYSWELDAQFFYYVEDWVPNASDHSTRTPQYFYAYQSNVISGIDDVLKLVSDGQMVDVDINPPLSPSLIKQIQSCFFDTVSATLDSIMKLVIQADKADYRRSLVSGSKRSSVSNPLKRLIDINGNNKQGENADDSVSYELLPDNMNEEKKTLLILSSLEQIRDSKLPSLFRMVEKSLRINSREASTAIKESIDTMTNTLFELYNRRKKTFLAEGLRHGVLQSGIQWSSNISASPTAVSSYVYECLLNFVVVHSRVSEIAPAQVNRVITVLYDHVVKTLLSCYREVEQFGRYGLLQVIADIGLVRVTMERFQTPEMLQIYSLMYDCVKEATINKKQLWESSTPPWEIIHPLVLEAQTSSKAEFRCFLSAK